MTGDPLGVRVTDPGMAVTALAPASTVSRTCQAEAGSGELGWWLQREPGAGTVSCAPCVLLRAALGGEPSSRRYRLLPALGAVCLAVPWCSDRRQVADFSVVMVHVNLAPAAD